MDKFFENAQNVVAMTDHLPDRNFALLSQVEAYWDALRGDALLPRRSDIDPRGIENALEFAFILERIAPGVARLRIAGSHLGDLMGMEVRGMPITAFLAPASRRRFSDMMEDLFETPATAVLTLTDPASGLFARMLLLPLRSDMGDTSRMLGCLVSQGANPDLPCRFEIQHIQMTPVSVPSVKPATAIDGYAEPPAAFRRGGKTPPYLRLVTSKD